MLDISNIQTIEHDVIVVGAGGAGIRAAIECSMRGLSTGLVCKSLLGKAHTVMAEGGVAQSLADLAVAVTGVAGPDGGTVDKPVGLVHLAGARVGRETLHFSRNFLGDRDEVRLGSVLAGLGLLHSIAE